MKLGVQETDCAQLNVNGTKSKNLCLQKKNKYGTILQGFKYLKKLQTVENFI